jgi:hypothetical protein
MQYPYKNTLRSITGPFTIHATLLKGSAALQNLRIPILPPKTIDFPTSRTQFPLPSELEVDLFTVFTPFSKGKILQRGGSSL